MFLLPAVLSSLTLVACMADEDLTPDEQAAIDEAETGTTTEALAAVVPAVPSLSSEFATCRATVADYLVLFKSTGATSYDVEYRRGSGAWAQLYAGSATSTHFTTANYLTTVTFRARACTTAGCSAYRTGTPFYPQQCSGAGGL